MSFISILLKDIFTYLNTYLYNWIGPKMDNLLENPQNARNVIYIFLVIKNVPSF